MTTEAKAKKTVTAGGIRVQDMGDHFRVSYPGGGGGFDTASKRLGGFQTAEELLAWLVSRKQ